MTRRIVLIPLDGSRFSRSILQHICRTLPPELYALRLLRVVDPPTGITASGAWSASSVSTIPTFVTADDLERSRHPIYPMQQEQNTRSAVERALFSDSQALEQQGYDVSIETRFGDPVEEILGAARAADVAMIAMVTHGRTGLQHMALGSVSEQVLRRSHMPVLLVQPPQTSERAYSLREDDLATHEMGGGS